MKFLLRLLSLTGLLATAAFAAEPAMPVPDAAAALAPKKPEKSQWVFSLLPKSFQKNPRLDLTVITEMTEEGKKLPPVTPANPAYFIAQSSGYHQLGDSVGNEKTLPVAEVERILTRSLATSGYLPAKPPEIQPSLVVFYTWGTHSLLVEPDPDNPSLSPIAVERNILDRAAMVGGEKFARELLKLFSQADDMATANQMPPPDPSGAVAPISPILGPDQMAFANPVNLFKMQNPKNEFLVDQAADDIYYVVASAYDYRAISQHQRILLWRTRMTVAAQGVSEVQTLPTLITTAGPYFGKDMGESEILSRRPVPDGRVEIGEPVVVGNEPVAPKKDPSPKKP